MRRLAEIDAKLIDFCQDAYLWLYDRTGIYLATVIVALILAGSALVKMNWVTLCLTAGLIILVGPTYLLQAFNLQSALNAQARATRSSKWRYWFLVAMLVMAPSPKLGEVVDTILMIIAIGYLQVIQIRDREPKDFLLKLTHVGSGA